jgi:adenylyl-sulfate kinase
VAGYTVWLTGLPSSGKTTIGDLVAADLGGRGVLVERLDGDVVRRHLSAELGFSREDRDANIARIGWVASRLTRAGAAVVVSAISPYAEARTRARELVEAHGRFVEVYVHASLEECIRRDVKGLYARALAGDLDEMTGISDPYEEPVAPEVRLDTEVETPDESAGRVLNHLEGLGLA